MLSPELVFPTLGLVAIVVITVGSLTTVFLRVLVQIKTVNGKLDGLDLKTSGVASLLSAQLDQLKTEMAILQALNATLQDRLRASETPTQTIERQAFMEEK